MINTAERQERVLGATLFQLVYRLSIKRQEDREEMRKESEREAGDSLRPGTGGLGFSERVSGYGVQCPMPVYLSFDCCDSLRHKYLTMLSHLLTM